MDNPKHNVPQAVQHLRNHPQHHKKTSPNKPFYIVGSIVVLCLGITIFGLGFFVGSVTSDGSSFPINNTNTTVVKQKPDPTPNPESMTNWKAFRDTDFSFRYPPSWTQDQTLLTTERNTNQKTGGDFTPGIATIAVLIDDTPVKTLADQTEGVEKTELLEIDGQQAARLTGHTGAAGSVYFITALIPVNGKTVILNLSTQNDDLVDPVTSEFDQMLNTFQSQPYLSSVSPTCRPRPACLDSTPRCLIAETADMCPKTTK